MDWGDIARLSGFLSLYVVIPLGLGFLSAVLEKFKRGGRVSDILAVVCMLFLVLLCLASLMHVQEGGTRVRWSGGWELIGISRVLDGLSALMLVVINLVVDITYTLIDPRIRMQ